MKNRRLEILTAALVAAILLSVSVVIYQSIQNYERPEPRLPTRDEFGHTLK
tara:strand:+ start:86 stop:238 length:153 start_codon:yes stop_codon:yes gene_type:complete